MNADKKKKGHLTPAELRELREALLEKRREIAEGVSELEDQAVRSSGDDVSVDHMADHGSDSYEKDQTIGRIERESGKLQAVDLALKKIQEGTYGICAACGVAVKKPRLKAIPYARLCLGCKMKEEQGLP